jgi:DNA mismatch repair protein MutL
MYQLKAGETLSQRVKKIFPDAVSDDLIEISSDEKGMKVSGLVGMPSGARANGKYQYVFLNGRFIRDKFISHAMKESYRGLIEAGIFPIAFLFLEMDVESFDVNVHPTKVEVRFDNSNLVHSQVMAVIKEKLRSIDLDAAASFRKAGLSGTAEHAGQQDEGVRGAIDDFFKRHKQPIATNQNKFNFGGGGGEASAGRSEAKENFRQNFYAQGESSSSGMKVIQIHDSYIVAETDDGFEIIDQHALHERILYQKMLVKVEGGEKLESQKQLIPVSFDVSDSEAELIEQNLELLGKLGIEVEAFGPGVMAVQSFPVLLGKADIALFMRDTVDILSEKGNIGAEELVHEVLDMAACKAAIKAGQKLTALEMEQLLKDRETVERASNCPHGRPSTIKFGMADIESQFKRT